MRVVCAWCKREGRAVILGEREPLADTTETHGICSRHSKNLLEQLPSRSFPGIRLLLVARPTETALHHYLTRAFAGLPDVKVIRDRRQGERRGAPTDVAVERRRANRRLRHAEFSSLGYLTVRFGAKDKAGLELTHPSSAVST